MGLNKPFTMIVEQVLTTKTQQPRGLCSITEQIARLGG
jgi:hypothetical protein